MEKKRGGRGGNLSNGRFLIWHMLGWTKGSTGSKGRTWALAATHTFFLRPGTSIPLGATWEQKSIVTRRDETAAVLDLPAPP